MTPAELADLRRIAASQFMIPMMSRETLVELLAAHDAVVAAGTSGDDDEVSPYLRAPPRSLAEVLRERAKTARIVVVRDLLDMGQTANTIGTALAEVGMLLGETYAEGDLSEPVVAAAVPVLRDAIRRIAILIGELEAEAG